jgi:hypothetical protein
MRRPVAVGLTMLLVMADHLYAFEQRSDVLDSENARWVQVNFERQGRSYSCKAFDVEVRVGQQLIVAGTYTKRFPFTQSQSDATRRASIVTIRVRCGKRFWIFRDLLLVLSPSTWTFGLDTRPYSHAHEIELDREYSAVWIKTMRITPDNGLESTDFRWCAAASRERSASPCRERWGPVSVRRH